MDQETAVIGKDISIPLAATAILRQNGFTLNQTAEALKVSKPCILQRQHKLPKHLDLTSKTLVLASVKAVKTIVAGGLVGEMEKVNGTHVLQAAGMVLDRHQPLKQADSGASVNYTQVNINVYK